MTKRKKIFLIASVGFLIALFYWIYKGMNGLSISPNPKYSIGEVIDSLDGVSVHYNGMVGHSGDRNVSNDGYNIGIRYQCVEFVKRYYYQHFHHRMPDSHGNAKDFFDPALPDGNYNSKRGLIQYSNPSRSKPEHGDLIIFDGSIFNPYGHVAIISDVTDSSVTIVQQNPGPFADSRVDLSMDSSSSGFLIKTKSPLGWLRHNNQ